MVMLLNTPSGMPRFWFTGGGGVLPNDGMATIASTIINRMKQPPVRKGELNRRSRY